MIEERRTDVEEKASPSRTKRRRLSRSISRSPVKKPRKDEPSQIASYTCPTQIADIFDRKISAKQLCTLSAITHGTPEKVREIVPGATIDQICQMVKL